MLIYKKFSLQHQTSSNRQPRSIHTERLIWKTRSSKKKPKKNSTSYVTGMIKKSLKAVLTLAKHYL